MFRPWRESVRRCRIDYDAERTYRVGNDQGKIYAQEVVYVQYQAPDRKNFVTVSEEGSPLIRHLVLKRLVQSEEEAASGREHRNSAIRPDNYSFILLGEQDLGSYRCYALQAIHLRMDKYLFVGKFWISTEDFGIVRIKGQPARKLSFWITRADSVRQYQKMGELWLPVKDETIVLVASDSESSEYVRRTWRQMLLAALPARYAHYMGADWSIKNQVS